MQNAFGQAQKLSLHSSKNPQSFLGSDPLNGSGSWTFMDGVSYLSLVTKSTSLLIAWASSSVGSGHTASRAITPKGAMVAWDGVIVWVQVFASGVGGIPLNGGMVGSGCAWHWCGITTALIIGGSPLLPVPVPDDPATGGSPETSWMLVSWFAHFIL